MISSRKRIPAGLARVRKAMPPPAKVIGTRKATARRQAKEELRRELKESSPADD